MLTEEPRTARTCHCQYCRAEIEWDVQKCRHCGEWVGDAPEDRARGPVPASRRRVSSAPGPGTLGWVATIALAAGVFLPFLTIPVLGGVSLWHVGDDGLYVVGLAAAALLAHWRQWRRVMLGATVPAAGIVGYDFFRAMSEMPTEMGGMVSFGIGAFVMVAASVAAVIAAWAMD